MTLCGLRGDVGECWSTNCPPLYADGEDVQEV